MLPKKQSFTFGDIKKLCYAILHGFYVFNFYIYIYDTFGLTLWLLWSNGKHFKNIDINFLAPFIENFLLKNSEIEIHGDFRALIISQFFLHCKENNILSQPTKLIFLTFSDESFSTSWSQWADLPKSMLLSTVKFPSVSWEKGFGQ